MNFFTKLFRSRDKPTNPKGLASRRGKERVPGPPLHFLLNNSPNPEMPSLDVFRQTAVTHLLLWGNFSRRFSVTA